MKIIYTDMAYSLNNVLRETTSAPALDKEQQALFERGIEMAVESIIFNIQEHEGTRNFDAVRFRKIAYQKKSSET